MEANTIDTTDRISMLPDSIVHHILSYLLDDPKSRIRMSVLSKGWFTVTASFPILCFRSNWPWYCLFPTNYDRSIMETFYRYVEYTVSRFCDQNISAHTLIISAGIINIKPIELFGHCLDLVIQKGLQVMDIRFTYYPENLPMLRLPNTLLSASSLTSLTLHKCELPSSLMVSVVKFKSLRLLRLSALQVDEGVIDYLTKSCPLLKEIRLISCYGFRMFCVKRHHNLHKVEIYSHSGLEIIDVNAPNLSYFLLAGNEEKAPSMILGLCKNLTTFVYKGFPFKRFNDFISNFPFLENVTLQLPSHVNNLKLSSHSLRKLRLQAQCDLDEIDLYAPKLLFFEYRDRIYSDNFAALLWDDSSLPKGCMKCETTEHFDILWFEKLKKFLDKNNIFKVMKLVIRLKKFIDVEEVKLIESPPYELEHVELDSIWPTPDYVALMDVVLWCCRPRSLTLDLNCYTDKGDVVKYTYKKLLQQEDEGQTNMKFVLISSSKEEQHFSHLNSLLKVLSLRQFRCKITFIKEEAVQENGACKS